MRRFILAAPVAALFVLLGAVIVSAATSATQNVSFTVPAAVSLTSNGDVAFGTISGPTTKTGSFAISSNDANGFQMAVSTSAATYLESGTTGCTPSHSVSVSSISVNGAAVTGQTTGTGGTPTAQFALSTTATNIFTTVPTAQGTTITETVTYSVNGSAIPANSGTCQYVVPTSWIIGAQ
jgi:hypothetical protein